MKYLLLLLLPALFLFSCEDKAVCSCGRGSDKLLILDAIDDSIVVCNEDSIYSESKKVSWKEHLSSNSFMSNGNNYLLNCKTEKPIEYDKGYHAVIYKNKALLLTSQFSFQYWDTTGNRSHWNSTFAGLYEERIYAENGEIKKSKKKLVIQPPYINKAALKDLEDKFQLLTDEQERHPGSAPDTRELIGLLFTASLNKDSLSRDRLLNFADYFPTSARSRQLGECRILLELFEGE